MFETKKEEKTFDTKKRCETNRCFTTAQKVMEGYVGYKVEPEHYDGCVDINDKV